MREKYTRRKQLYTYIALKINLMIGGANNFLKNNIKYGVRGYKAL